MVLKRERIATKNFGHKECFVFILAMLFLTDITILLNIPFLRQILGFLFLTILPGLLILQILKLNKIDFLEKFVLTWGLSISFLMFFWLLTNSLLLGCSYETPLSTISLLISFNLVFVLLTIIGYKTNKDSIFSLPNINLSTSEKAFLIVPVMFPALSIFGMYVMNTTDNNILLMSLLLLIPTYVASICFFNHKFPKRLYPVVIFLISISLLLLLSLRSNHIIGRDVHLEYYFFRTTLDNLHWNAFGHSTLDACLAISLLPTIYQSILNMSPEFLFKILYSLIYSVSPLVIYIISKKYVGEGYAFLASCFYMFQSNFLFTEYNARANIAMFFFAFAMMALFSDKIDPVKKRALLIVFMASCMVSHYSTTYIFFFIMFGTFIGIEILSKKYNFKKVISLTIVILFFSMVFFWYSQVTETAFNAGVSFVEKTLSNLNKFFVEESRAGTAQALLGEGIMEKGIPHRIEFVFTWLTFVLIGIGIHTLIRKYKEMSFPESNFKKADFLKNKFEVEYFVLALACVGLLVAVVTLPYISVGYGLDRMYPLAITILSVFFVIGGIMLAKYLNRAFAALRGKGKALTNLSLKKKPFFGKKSFTKRSLYLKNSGKENSSQLRAYLIILLVLIPYFLCVTGVMYQVFGVPRAIILNSEGVQYDKMYVHDQESYGAKWLKGHAEEKNLKVYGDAPSVLRLTSQATMILGKNAVQIFKPREVKNYVYLNSDNIINDRLNTYHEYYNITEYSIMFIGKNKIYNNGGSEIYK